ncbi:hypothetical protein MMC11_004889 [Xylographa trunciseda]|nr:hypothetical protein [Xylographa trunciseda]
MKVLLLGATGKVGSRMIPALLVHKHQVVVYVRSESKLRNLVSSSALSETTIVPGDATDATAISETLVKHQCDALVNCAGQAALPFQAPRMQEIINAVATAAVDASKKLNRPIRACFPMFTEHALTYACLRNQPPENLQWSILCPSAMTAAIKEIGVLTVPRPTSLTASADVPPSWRYSYFVSIPIIGPLFSVLGNALRYGISLEDCAEFMAADLEKAGSEFVGHRVGLINEGKGKVD